MLARIIRHEWRNLTADRTLWLVTITFALLIGYGVYNGAAWIKSQSARLQRLSAEQKRELDKNKAKLNGAKLPGESASDPASPAALGEGLHHATLPFAPTAVLSVGMSDLLSSSAGVSVLSLQRTEADKTGFENPLGFLAGRFDLSFVIVYLFPLLILALSYNLLSAEREQGTLPMVLAQPIGLKKFALGKVALRATVVCGLALALSIVGVLLGGADVNGAGFWPRVWLWAVMVVAYGTFWFALALLVNARGYGSATNAVALAALWLALVLIIPSLINVTVSSLYPVPSRTEVITALRGVNLDMRRDGSRLLSEFYQDHPELMPKDQQVDTGSLGLAFVNIQQEHKRRTGEVERRFDGQLARQQALVNRLRFLSPAIVTQEALNDIAGTGIPRYQEFKRQVRRFDQEWSAFFLPKIYSLAKLTAADYDAVPRFAFVEEPFGTLIRRSGVGLGGLVLPAAVIALFALRRLRRYPIAN